MRKVIYSLTGMTCSGKTLFAEKMTEPRKGSASFFQKVLSVTTRPQRNGEINDIHYRFVGNIQFKKFFSAGMLLEHTIVNNEYYGLLKNDLNVISSLWKIPLVIVDPTGVQNIKDVLDPNEWELITIFLDTKFEIVINRLLSRLDEGSNISNSPDIRKRLIHMIDKELDWKTAHSYDIILPMDKEEDLENGYNTVINTLNTINVSG